MIKPFDLITPDTVSQALEKLWQHENAKIVAGGTDVFVNMHKGTSYEILIDIKGLKKLNNIEFNEKDGLKIGALATMRQITRNEDVNKYYPALVDGLSSVGSVQVRSKATLAGNICNASPAADSAGPLLLYDAVVIAKSKEKERAIAISDFFTGPKQTCLEKGEMVTQIILAPPTQHSGSGYVKLKKRGAMEIGIMSAGAKLATDNSGKCTMARVSISAVNATPLRVKKAEDFLVGKELTNAILIAATEFAYELAAPITWRNSEEWSKEMVRVYMPMAMEKALERKGKGGY